MGRIIPTLRVSASEADAVVELHDGHRYVGCVMIDWDHHGGLGPAVRTTLLDSDGQTLAEHVVISARLGLG